MTTSKTWAIFRDYLKSLHKGRIDWLLDLYGDRFSDTSEQRELEREAQIVFWAKEELSTIFFSLPLRVHLTTENYNASIDEVETFSEQMIHISNIVYVCWRFGSEHDKIVKSMHRLIERML